MRNDSWNQTIFGGIEAVNRNLFQAGLPETAAALLQGMQDCLCSGDGLSPQTAFRAKRPDVAERVLWMLGLGRAVTSGREEDGCRVLSLSDNPYGIGAIYFTH